MRIPFKLTVAFILCYADYAYKFRSKGSFGPAAWPKGCSTLAAARTQNDSAVTCDFEATQTLALCGILGSTTIRCTNTVRQNEPVYKQTQGSITNYDVCILHHFVSISVASRNQI